MGVKGAVLYVDVDHSARLHDLTLRKPRLLKKLQGFFGEKGAGSAAVSDIIFRISDDKR
jgi:predicted nucleic acid-binding Zn ribbon protein